MLAAVLLLVACENASTPNEEPADSLAESIESHRVENSGAMESDSVPKNIQVDSVIHLSFAPDSISTTVKGHLDKKGNPVICYLPVTKGDRLSASLIPENKNATIRFSHIIMPDGKSDGPFGSTMKYALRQKGVYRIYIGPNKMAGDPVSTNFVVNVKVE